MVLRWIIHMARVILLLDNWLLGRLLGRLLKRLLIAC